MSTSALSYTYHSIKFEFSNWVASDPLPRDQTQSNRLHEPANLINTIDPMTGDDIDDVTQHPHIEDGNLTIYFETETTRKSFIEMPLNHPYHRLPYPASDEDDRGG